MNKKTSKKVSSRKAAAESQAKSYMQESIPDLNVSDGTSGLKEAITILTNRAEPVEKRQEALQMLQAASFGTTQFEGVREDYTAALRDVAQDPEMSLRQRVLGLLSLQNDPYAEKVLLDGLKDVKKALVPASDALSYLGNNAHSGVQSIARTIFDGSKDTEVRQQALRVMAGDPQSLKTIQKTLADKTESVDVRQLCATALHALDPKSLQTWARKAVMDEAEDQTVVATGLTALSHFGDAEKITSDPALKKRITEMRSKATATVKKAATEIAKRYAL